MPAIRSEADFRAWLIDAASPPKADMLSLRIEVRCHKRTSRMFLDQGVTMLNQKG